MSHGHWRLTHTCYHVASLAKLARKSYTAAEAMGNSQKVASPDQSRQSSPRLFSSRVGTERRHPCPLSLCRLCRHLRLSLGDESGF